MNLKFEQISQTQICELILNMDKEFASRISLTVDIQEWSEKLSKYARFIVSYHCDEISAVIAFYENKDDSLIYIPFVCTHPMHRRKGLARSLIEKLLDYADSNGYNVELEVLKTNYAAISAYESTGFKIYSDNGSKFKMRRENNVTTI